MKKEMVLHVALSQYAHALSDTRLVIRLRAAKNDLTKCTLFYGDTACRTNPITFYPVKMHVVAQDEFFDYYEADFESRFHRIYYYFQLEDGMETVYYYADFFRDELSDDRSEYYKIPFNHRADRAKVPDWLQDAVVYNIFPDSFASGKRSITGKGITVPYQSEHMTENISVSSKNGGTIRGIMENVDYIQQLGINCIYINPMFAAGEYHKYDTIDYFAVDPCFGNHDDFRDMVQTMHEHGIRVIIDGVFNHCGWRFFAFDDVVRNQEKSRYTDWFYHLKFPVERPQNPDVYPTYECFAYERLMPKLNTENPEVRAYLLQVGAYWIREFDIDGWRLDVASELSDDFLRDFRKTVKEVKENSVIIGEVWETANHWLQGDMFDSTMNYDMRKHCNYFFAKEKIDAAQFSYRVTNMLMRYKKNVLSGQLNLLDSHDVSRFLSECGSDERKYKLAVLFQLFFPGAPSVFYGDEQALQGMQEEDYRRPMEWDCEKTLYHFFREAIAIRNENTCIRRGRFETIIAEEKSRLFGFRCVKDNVRVKVFLNAGTQQTIVPSNQMKGNILMQSELDGNQLGAYGYVVMKETD